MCTFKLNTFSLWGGQRGRDDLRRHDSIQDIQERVQRRTEEDEKSFEEFKRSNDELINDDIEIVHMIPPNLT